MSIEVQFWQISDLMKLIFMFFWKIAYGEKLNVVPAVSSTTPARVIRLAPVTFSNPGEMGLAEKSGPTSSGAVFTQNTYVVSRRNVTYHETYRESC